MIKDKRVYQYLVTEHKCDEHAKDELGLTPVDLGRMSKGTGSIEDALVQLDHTALRNLLKEGANWLQTATTADLSLRQLALHGNFSAFKEAIESSPEKAKLYALATAAGPDGETILHDVAFAGHLELVKYLVNQWHSDINLQDSDGHSPP